ncbi:MAG: hypothetical protein ACLFTZ_00220 [Acholeplasmataceae bacterium]
MDNQKNTLWNVLLFGAIWGIVEATLGYVLQFLPSLVSGSVMFPVGATILFYAYRKTGSRKSLFGVALIAAAIKSVNLFMPGLMPIKTYNPMIAILLQTLVVVAVVDRFESPSFAVRIPALIAVGFAWRSLFLFNIAINNALTGFPFPQLGSLSAALDYLLLLGAMEGLILVVMSLSVFRLPVFRKRPNPALVLGLVALAFVLTIWI